MGCRRGAGCRPGGQKAVISRRVWVTGTGYEFPKFGRPRPAAQEGQNPAPNALISLSRVPGLSGPFVAAPRVGSFSLAVSASGSPVAATGFIRLFAPAAPRLEACRTRGFRGKFGAAGDGETAWRRGLRFGSARSEFCGGRDVE
jgi:hypothetical protein